MIVRNLVFTTLQKGFNFPFMKFALLNNMTYKTLLWSQILQTLFSWFQTYFNKRLKTFKTLNNDTLNIIRPSAHMNLVQILMSTILLNSSSSTKCCSVHSEIAYFISCIFLFIKQLFEQIC